MLEGLSKLMYAGLGAVQLTRQRAEEFFDECVKKGQADPKARSRFVQDLLASAKDARQDLEKVVTERVEKAVAEMRLATREDVARLEAKLDRLLEKRHTNAPA